jgi:molybdopterin synthase sulfur carrier subunit
MTDPTLATASSAAKSPIEATTVTVRLVYLARLREVLGTSAEALVVAGAAPTVEDVLRQLRARGDAFALELAPGRAFRVAVNHARARAGTVVHDGDEVALLPPVTGG